jgi:hypothetical protein
MNFDPSPGVKMLKFDLTGINITSRYMPDIFV